MTFSKSIQEHLRDEHVKHVGTEPAKDLRKAPATAPPTSNPPPSVNSAVAHGIASIQSTDKYSLFKKIKANRKVDPAHVNKLVKAIKQKNLLHLNPIVVDGDMNVIDGQHRLEAAKKLGCNIYYTKDAQVSMDDIAGMNSNKKNWSMTDYIEFYAKKGIPEFKVFRDFCYKHSEYQVSMLVTFCSSTGKRNSAAIKEGSIDVGNVEKAELLISYLEDFKKHTELAVGLRFIEAVTTMALHSEYDHERMISKLAANPTAVVPCANKKQYIMLLQTMFNKGVHYKNIVLFVKR